MEFPKNDTGKFVPPHEENFERRAGRSSMKPDGKFTTIAVSTRQEDKRAFVHRRVVTLSRVSVSALQMCVHYVGSNQYKAKRTSAIYGTICVHLPTYYHVENGYSPSKIRRDISSMSLARLFANVPPED